MYQRLFVVSILSLALISCSGPSPSSTEGTAATLDRPAASINKDDYPVFPDADAGADPAVPAAQGGKGFTGEGWETNTSYDLIGDPNAVKGGTFKSPTSDFPATLRPLGINTNEWNAIFLKGLVYETLLGLHPTTLEYMPALATHWQISEDRTTFRFRLNPNTKFSDGSPVTAEDVVASFKLHADKSLQDPGYVTWLKFETPVAESKYIVSVKTREAAWQHFLFFSNSIIVMPAAVLKTFDGAKYLREWNYKMVPGTGPYWVKEEDIDKGNTITIRRRQDYWGEKVRASVGANNFDEIRAVAVRDRNTEFEMFKKGDLDYYFVNRAAMWVQELDFDLFQRGLLQKRKIWNHAPQGIQGLAFNTRKAPFDDVRVRKALRHLFNREQMVEKLMFNQYELTDSQYTSTVYENPDNEKIKFDPQAAIQLLAEAGWKDRNDRGRLIKDGRPFVVELQYYDKNSERFFTVFQQDADKAGITLNLRYVNPETAFKLLDERKFELFSISWTGTLFPFPETSFHSRVADQAGSNNITGFKNKRADEIIDAYDQMFDLQDRIKAIRELDGILSREHHYIYEWDGPYQRIAFWNRYGYPKGIITRTGRYRDIYTLLWIDPKKQQLLDQARNDANMKLDVGESDDRYWLEFARAEEVKRGEAGKAPGQ